MLELSDWEFKTMMVNMDKVDGTEEQVGNISRELEILRTKYLFTVIGMYPSSVLISDNNLHYKFLEPFLPRSQQQ